ncbi:MAG: hypothetical protein V4485_01940 [Pseudomonadota bacterium]
MLARLLIFVILFCTKSAFSSGDASLPPLPEGYGPPATAATEPKEVTNPVTTSATPVVTTTTPAAPVSPVEDATVTTAPTESSEPVASTSTTPSSDSSFISKGKYVLPKAEILDITDNAEPIKLPSISNATLPGGPTEPTPKATSEPTSEPHASTASEPTSASNQPSDVKRLEHLVEDIASSIDSDTPKSDPKAALVTPNTDTKQPALVTPPAVTVASKPTQKDEHEDNSLKHTTLTHDGHSQKLHNGHHQEHHATKDTPLTPEHEQFIKNEVVMLLLEDDNTNNAIIAQLIDDAEVHEYIRQFWHDYDYYRPNRAAQREEIELFVSGYHDYYLYNSSGDLSKQDAQKQLFESVAQGSVFDVRAIIDNYQLLQSRDDSGNNMLNIASFSGDALMAKFLLLRGVDLYAINYSGDSPRSIAQNTKNPDIYNLLQSAAFLGR